MKTCAYSVTLEELLKRPTDLLVLVGAEEDPADAEKDDPSDDEDGDDDDDSDEDDDDDNDDDDNDDDDSGDPKDKSKSKKLSERQQEIADLKDETARHKKRRAASEERVTRLLAENAELKKNGSKDEQLKTELGDANKKVATLEPLVQQLNVQVAFLRDNTIAWKDPEAALKLADLSDVTFEGGKAEGLSAALRDLAKRKPYLVADKTADKPPARRSGDKPAGKGRGKSEADAAARKASFAARYPALNK